MLGGLGYATHKRVLAEAFRRCKMKNGHWTGINMKMTSVLKVILLAGAVALPASFSVAEAKAKPPLPPGACAFEKTGIPTATICSFNSDPKTMWSQQQLCVNGILTP